MFLTKPFPLSCILISFWFQRQVWLPGISGLWLALYAPDMHTGFQSELPYSTGAPEFCAHRPSRTFYENEQQIHMLDTPLLLVCMFHCPPRLHLHRSKDKIIKIAQDSNDRALNQVWDPWEHRSMHPPESHAHEAGLACMSNRQQDESPFCACFIALPTLDLLGNLQNPVWHFEIINHLTGEEKEI